MFVQRTRTMDASGVPLDQDLVGRAAGGEASAFDELYRRHSPTAWRVAQAVTRSPDDAADAVSEAFTRVFASLSSGALAAGAPFRPYLIAATRNAAIDILRRSGRVRPTEDVEASVPPSRASPWAPGPSESVLAGEDASLVATAFRGLPERWRSVLWLTEVEGIPAREAAGLLGLSANGAAQLAVRARAGLRDRYLQAHVRNHARRECLFTVEHLGAYVGGGLSARDLAKVDQHLTGCPDCRDRLAEIEDLGTTLRRIMVPVPLALGTAVGASRLKLALAAASRARGAKAGARVVRHTVGRAHWALAGAAAGLVAAGLFGALNTGGPTHVRSATPRAPTVPTRLTPASGWQVSTPPPPPATPPNPAVGDPSLALAVSTATLPATSPPAPTPAPSRPSLVRSPPVPSSAPAVVTTTPPATATPPAPPTTTPTAGPPADSATPPSAPRTGAPVLQVTVSASSGSGGIGVAYGAGPGACNGLILGTTPLGCPPALKPTPSLSVGVVGTAVPVPTSLSLP